MDGKGPILKSFDEDELYVIPRPKKMLGSDADQPATPGWLYCNVVTGTHGLPPAGRRAAPPITPRRRVTRAHQTHNVR